MVMPVVLLMLFGILEMGLLFKDYLMCQQAVREGARAAALGANSMQVTLTVAGAASTLDPAKLTLTFQYRTWNGTSWDSWATLGNSSDGATNNAPPGAQVRVMASYRHALLTGSLFRFIADSAGQNTVTVNAAAICRRE
jgi:Flp pilus assembly protein TadG